MKKKSKWGADVESGRAISIKQPYVEAILQGKKRYEYRSRQTHIRGRVYLYVSLREVADSPFWKKIGYGPGELPTGVIVGSVEIVDCEPSAITRGEFQYKLKNPRRYKEHRAPRRHAQPCFFFPFVKKK
jgi:hypothetical protein